MEQLSDYDFFLPEELIAQYAPDVRGSSRLMALLAHEERPRHQYFSQIGDYLLPGDVLVVNNTKVMKARIELYKKSGGRVQVLLVRPLENNGWQLLMSGKGPFLPNTSLFLDRDGQSPALRVLEKSLDEEGLYVVEALCDLKNLAEEKGEMPLPPYLGRKAEKRDEYDYQPIFAKDCPWGAVAAPTASLHFTKELLLSLTHKGVQIVEITLHVGPGTFLPVRVENIAEHRMHKEFYSLSAKTALIVNKAKAQGKKIIAVGTTALRVLEHVALNKPENKLEESFGESALFIRPGFDFRIADALISNFHLPKSTLLMLVAAAAGKDKILKAYAEAIDLKYRFFSYGDATYIDIKSK
jgi:S-adenosylmethionine:tRNA ribosyltransferase-isomerase